MSKTVSICRDSTLAILLATSIAILAQQCAYAHSLTFAIGTSETPPRKWKKDGQYMGIYVDIVNEINSRTDIDIKLKPSPQKRLLRALQNGEIDAAVGLYKTSERQQYATYIDSPIAYSSLHLFVKKAKPFSLQAFNDLSGKTIGKIRSVFISNDFLNGQQQGLFAVAETATYKQLIGKLFLERIDAFVGPTLSTQFLLLEMEIGQQITMLPYSIAPRRPLYIVFSNAASTPEKQHMFNEIRQILASMARENTFELITNKYGIAD